MNKQDLNSPPCCEQMHIDFAEFETPGAEMFGDGQSPAFIVNRKFVGANSVCVRLMDNVDYVEFAISRSRKLLLLIPCSEFFIHGYKWVKEKNGKRYATSRLGVPFVRSLCRMMDWDPDQRHKIPGKLIDSDGIEMMSFDLTAAKHYDKPLGNKKTGKQILFEDYWNGSFGAQYSESRRTLQVNRFDQLTVWSVKEGNTEQAYDLSEEDNNI